MDGISSGDDDLPDRSARQATSGGDMNSQLGEHQSSSEGPASHAATAAPGDVDSSSLAADADTREHSDSRYAVQ
jgi:hypothetical protein